MPKIMAEIRRWNDRYELGLEGLLPRITPDQAPMVLEMIEDFLDRLGPRALQRNPERLVREIEERLTD